MKIISWNINGIRSVCNKGFKNIIQKLNPDILLLQEIKAHEEILSSNKYKILGFTEIWHSAQKKGYAGVGAYTKKKPFKIIKQIGFTDLDCEGRLLALEYGDFYLVNIYLPHSGRKLQNLDKKLSFNQKFLEYYQYLQNKKPLIIGGDFNVAHKEIDLARPKSNFNNAGFTVQERKSFDKFLEHKIIDSFRQFNNNKGNYTWWLQAYNARARNIGWRLDYFLVDHKLTKKLKSANILPKITGSDHCPIEINLNS